MADYSLQRDLQADVTLLMAEADLDPTGLACTVVLGTRQGHCALAVRSPDEVHDLATTLELTETPPGELAVGEQSACLTRPELKGLAADGLEAWVGSRMPKALKPLKLAGRVGQLVLFRRTDGGQSCIALEYL